MVVFVIFPNEASWSAPLPPQSASLQSMHVQLSCLRSFFLSQKAQWLLPLSKGKVIPAWVNPKTSAEWARIISAFQTASQARPPSTRAFLGSLLSPPGYCSLFPPDGVLLWGASHWGSSNKNKCTILSSKLHSTLHNHGWHKLDREILIGLSHKCHVCLCV